MNCVGRTSELGGQNPAGQQLSLGSRNRVIGKARGATHGEGTQMAGSVDSRKNGCSRAQLVSLEQVFGIQEEPKVAHQSNTHRLAQLVLAAGP